MAPSLLHLRQHSSEECQPLYLIGGTGDRDRESCYRHVTDSHDNVSTMLCMAFDYGARFCMINNSASVAQATHLNFPASASPESIFVAPWVRVHFTARESNSEHLDGALQRAAAAVSTAPSQDSN